MVEIFKGKDSDGVWHEGFYCVFNDKAHRIYTGYAETDCGEYYPDCYTVIPETVRKCAGGITDKNGKMLFEGDIVKNDWCFIKGNSIVRFGEYKSSDSSNDYQCGHLGFYLEHISDFNKRTVPNYDPERSRPTTYFSKHIKQAIRYDVYTYYVAITQCLSTKSNIIIPDTIQNLPVYVIANGAFANQTAITSVTMTNNIIEIGDSAFAECINLQSVNLSKNLTTCGASAFADCDNIKAITIPASLYTIPSDMFSSCDRLTAVTIEEQQGEQSETETPSGSDSEEGRSISSSAFGSCDLLKKVWIPKDIKTIDSSAFSNSMENLTIYGEAQSAAAHYASENLLDFVVLGKNEFKNVASVATATEKMTLGDSVESDRWKISFNAAYSLRGSFNYTTSGKQKEKTLQNGNELIVLCYSVKNVSGSDQEFNFLDVSAKVNGYTHKISSYGSIGYSQLAQYDRLLVGKVKSGEILYGYIAIETAAGWKNASVQFLNDTALESYSFDIKADSKDITYIGSANDPAENAQASETVPAEIQTTEPITETEAEATSLKQS